MSRLELPCPGPVSRRSFVQLGSLALGGLTLPSLYQQRAVASAVSGEPAADTSVILVWLQGGPSHIDMYDMKPEAPEDYRGPFKPIQTNVEGLEICEHMPRQAKIADKLAVIRSIAHSNNQHAGGATRFLSGYVPVRPNDKNGSHPTIGSVVARVRSDIKKGIPNYISSTKAVYGGGGAYLGQAASPFVVDGDPNDPKFQVKNITARPGVLQKASLLSRLDTFRRELDRSGSMTAMDEFQEQALSLLTSEKVRAAFDLSKEPDRLRDEYGRNRWGQRALMARRLVEAGCSFVTMQMQRSPFGKSHNWDDHAVNWHVFDELKLRLPVYDQAVTALVNDIYARGLNKKVMLIFAGEFGRTPRINTNRGVGRGHWARAMSVVVSGGGMRMGQVIGSTNDKAEEPKDRRMEPNDLLATTYKFLGINTHQHFENMAGVPTRILPNGEPIAELA
ncbi:hypothetical protein Pan216_08040 [Planctomycetes bacterium Pan216]|uniref:Sulfatase n=1 Tax=Kolteria novifilia TaxID=2527975 RepID=A0A518AZ16_9BACT|nr:hypothetical protein Pan216_08040 [Planctomycetes bacterium Pan216]